MSFFAQMDGQFAGRGCLARTLQAHQHDGHRTGTFEIEGLVLRTHQRGELLVDDFYDLLARGQAGQHLLAKSLLLNVRDKRFDDPEMDIRLQQRHAHFTEALLDVAFRQLAVPLELLGYGIKLVGQVFKHYLSPISLLSS